MSTLPPEPVSDPYRVVHWERPAPLTRERRVPAIHIVLFVSTFITTSMAGAFQVGANPLMDPLSIRAGFPFSVTLLTILLCHEFGHYILAKVHRVRATLPYFIPAPPVLIGTFGAFIRMQSPPPNRRALFDVGAAGPWAGFIVAVPAAFIGLRLSEVRPLGLDEGGLALGDSVLFSWLTHLALGISPDSATILLHPIALAGWFGLFVTFLNLLPVGQLDGGHVSYALFGRAHRWLARLFIVAIAVLALRGWEGWFVWVLLLLVIGVDHPPTPDPHTPLDRGRRRAAWLTIGVFVLTFMAEPIRFQPPSPVFEGDMIEAAWPAAPKHSQGGVVIRLWGAPRLPAPRPAPGGQPLQTASPSTGVGV